MINRGLILTIAASFWQFDVIIRGDRGRRWPFPASDGTDCVVSPGAGPGVPVARRASCQGSYIRQEGPQVPRNHPDGGYHHHSCGLHGEGVWRWVPSLRRDTFAGHLLTASGGFKRNQPDPLPEVKAVVLWELVVNVEMWDIIEQKMVSWLTMPDLAIVANYSCWELS